MCSAINMSYGSLRARPSTDTGPPLLRWFRQTAFYDTGGGGVYGGPILILNSPDGIFHINREIVRRITLDSEEYNAR